MQTTFTARHFKAPENLKNYAIGEVDRFNKYYDGIVSCDIILTQEKKAQVVEISLSVSNGNLSATESSEDFYKSIDLVVEKMGRQLKKHKAKVRKHSHDKINELLSGPPMTEGGSG